MNVNDSDGILLVSVSLVHTLSKTTFTSSLPGKCQKQTKQTNRNQNLLSITLTHVPDCTHSVKEYPRVAEPLLLLYDLGDWGSKKLRETLPQTQSLYQIWVLSTEQCLHHTSPGRGQVWRKGYKIENTGRSKGKWRVRSPIKICHKSIKKESKCEEQSGERWGEKKSRRRSPWTRGDTQYTWLVAQPRA